jgi:hypothetical protein
MYLLKIIESQSIDQKQPNKNAHIGSLSVILPKRTKYVPIYVHSFCDKDKRRLGPS